MKKINSIALAATFVFMTALNASCTSTKEKAESENQEFVTVNVSELEANKNPDWVAHTLRTPEQLKRISKSGMEAEYSHTTVIISLEEDVTSEQIDELASDFGLNVVYKYSIIQGCALASPTPLSDSELDDLIDNLKKDPRVIDAGKDMIMHLYNDSNSMIQ